jgi:hypothetical protein
MIQSIRESATVTALMLGWFVLLMVPGFWLRFGMFPWEMI